MAADARWWTPLYAPHRLAEAALQPKALSMFFAGPGALACGLGLFLSAKVTVGGEPFHDLREYLWDYTRLGLLFAGLAFGPLMLIGMGLGILAGLPKWTVVARVLALWPTTMLPPWIVWCTVVALARASPNDFRQQPTWIGSPILDFAASHTWAATVLGAGFVLCCIAIRRALMLVRQPGHCPCGYPLTSPQGEMVCPECGSAWRVVAAGSNAESQERAT